MSASSIHTQTKTDVPLAQPTSVLLKLYDVLNATIMSLSYHPYTRITEKSLELSLQKKAQTNCSSNALITASRT